METTTSADGTVIAYERTGSGPPLVLVHGSAGDHTQWEQSGVRAALAEHVTVYAMDRRGRGGSGDADEYDIEREFEDVAAVVDAVGEPTALLGHSFGAICALEAALRTDGVARLVLYEPPAPREIVAEHLFSEAVATELEGLLADGERERALLTFLRDVVGLPESQVEDLQAAPTWSARVDAAHTLAREYRAPFTNEFDLERFAALDAPTLLLTGGESPRWAREATDALADALPNSRVAVFEGQSHVAMNTAPQLFVEEVLAFVREGATPGDVEERS